MAHNRGRGRLTSLHFVARAAEQEGKLVALGDGIFETGHWSKCRGLAPLATGAILHLHERQSERSWIAGPITGSEPSETEPGRMVFRFRSDDALRACLAGGWARDQARVWEMETETGAP